MLQEDIISKIKAIEEEVNEYGGLFISYSRYRELMDEKKKLLDFYNRI